MSERNSRSTWKVLFSGRVQGVGFRWTTQQLASAYPVTGYVRNLADGRVELVVQGNPNDVQSLLDDIQRRFESNITSVEQDVLTDAPAFADFRIVR